MNGYDLQNETVEALGALHISGDTVPPEFFQHIKFANGKADYLACLILADILYWYRPIRPRDERTGQPLEWRQKFAGPRLVREYSALADRLGATDRQVRDACARLKSLGFLLIFVRPLFTGGSVVEMEPVYDRISCILRPVRLTAERESGGPTHVETGVGLRQNVSRTTAERESYKEAEISTETSHRESARAPLCESEHTGGEVAFEAAEISTPAPPVEAASNVVQFASPSVGPNDDFAPDAPLPAPDWNIGERFVLKACGLWESPTVEGNWRLLRSIRTAGAFVASKIDIARRQGGTPDLWKEFWYETLNRKTAPRPEWIAEQWDAYDRWLIQNHEPHRARLAQGAA